MKHLIMLSVLTVALLALGCGSHSRYHSGYPYDHDRYYSYDRVKDLADDLEDATSRLEDEAKDTADHPSEGEHYALKKLDDLDEEADDFHSEVDHNHDLRKSDDDFRDVFEAYREARNAIRYLSPDDDLYREYDRVSQIMNELGRIYGYVPPQYGYYSY